ncbi:hypothetical protein niasHT_022029 [Heterodera trifolii]|uniref:Uncharacterized protein n=1 Tax=Heterodera trifolii TaxID=157864 RepID=A0ABD2JBJ3_9BILA
MENGAVGPTDGTDIITIQLVAMNKISPFWAALLKEQTKLVEIMLEKGQNPNHFGTFIWDEMKQTISPLHFAAQKGNLELCQMLVAKGAEVNQKTKDERAIVPLQMACGSGDLPIVKFFVERVGVDIESIDSNGDTVLVYALLGNKLEIGHFLITSGARTDRTNKFGISPMHICVTKGDLALCKFLVDNGANVNQKTSGGDQRLCLLHVPKAICKLVSQRPSVKLLIEEGNADIEIANSGGDTALILALLKGKIEIARYFPRTVSPFGSQSNHLRTSCSIYEQTWPEGLERINQSSFRPRVVRRNGAKDEVPSWKSCTGLVAQNLRGGIKKRAVEIPVQIKEIEKEQKKRKRKMGGGNQTCTKLKEGEKRNGNANAANPSVRFSEMSSLIHRPVDVRSPMRRLS